MQRVVYENELFELRADHARFLRGLLGTRLETVGTMSRIVKYAGHVVLPGGSVLRIRSRKASAASLLAWMAYADPRFESTRILGTAPQTADEGELAALVCKTFCVATMRALEQSGLLRAYTRQQVRTSTIRGRIDFSRIGMTGGDLSRTPCTVFMRLPHTPLNRLLAAALGIVRRDPMMREAAGASLAPLSAAFADVPAGLDRELLAGRCPLTRLEQPFEMAFGLAKLIVHTLGLIGGESVAGVAFLFDLASLFERAVVRAFQEGPYGSLKNHPVYYERTRGTAEPVAAGPMYLDVYLPDVEGQAVVVDAKFKLKVSSSNLQQMVTYCWLTGARRAALVFPKGELKKSEVYRFAAAGRRDGIEVHSVELDVGGRDLAQWRAAGASLVFAVSAIVSGPATAPSLPTVRCQ